MKQSLSFCEHCQRAEADYSGTCAVCHRLEATCRNCKHSGGPVCFALYEFISVEIENCLKFDSKWRWGPREL